jgi:hypothetical protein
MPRLYRLAVILSVVMTATTLATAYPISRLDFIVNNDLYNYGLLFSQDWALPYAGNLWSLNAVLLVAATLSAVALVILVLPFLRRVTDPDDGRATDLMKWVTVLFLSLAGILVTLSIVFVSRLDFLVHHDLYNFGLIFSPDWASSYWQTLTMVQILIFATIGVGFGIIALIFRSQLPVGGLRVALERLWLFPLIAGVAGIAIAYFLNSSILTIAGVGSVLCGGLMLFLTRERYIRKPLLDAAVKSQFDSLDKLVTATQLQEHTAVYLPPKYLANPSQNRAYLAPQLEKLTINDASKIITPPGDELVKVWEQRLGKHFVDADLHFLETTLPTLLIEYEVAERVNLHVYEDRMTLELRNYLYADGARDLVTASKALTSLGSPVTSAIACAIAKVTASPVVIRDEDLFSDTLTAEFIF